MSAHLSPEERAHYARHLILPGFGEEAQLRLKQARVLVVGAGGLGSPLLLYLAAAGVGTLGIIDPDTVDASNLQRQVLYTQDDLGQPKAEAAARRIQRLNPHIEVRAYREALHAGNARAILADYDIVADGTDNFPTRYLVSDACVLLGKVNVHAAIFRFDGQVAVFNAVLPDGRRSCNYRDLFPEPPAPGTVPDCAEGGVLGVLPGIIGALQATEVIKVAAGIGQPLVDKLLLFDALRMESRTLRMQPDPRNPISGPNPSITDLIDYAAFCGVSAQPALASITALDLMRMRAEQQPHQLIDVREPEEHAERNLGGELMPLGELEAHVGKIRRDVPVVVHCKSGKRSAQAIRILQAAHGFHNLLNLEGGILGFPET